jgi:hypothetical protein
MDLSFSKILFQSGAAKVLSLIVAVLVILLLSELLAVLFKLPDTNVIRPFG